MGMLDEGINLVEVIEEFEALTKDAGRVQEETLKKILEQNGGAEYLQKAGLHGRTDLQSFKLSVPLATHKDLEPYIARIANGEHGSILTGEPITAISLSSGTTQGKPKYVPFNDALMDSTLQVFRTNFAFRNREFPIGRGKSLQFIYSSKQIKSSGGLGVGTATTNVFRHPAFKSAEAGLLSQFCSPEEVIFGPDFHQSLYCHLLCALLCRDEVQFVASTFAHSIVHAFRTFEQVWGELCADIRDGVLSDRVSAASVRAAVSRLLKPDPDLADLVREACVRLSGDRQWQGLIPRLFPNAKYVHGIMTGSMEPYLKKLRHYAGGLPLLCADYGASEGWVAANVNPRQAPESTSFAVVPNAGLFEFIPLKGRREAEAVGLTEVEVGEEYEIVVTNAAGLYRYRLGDVVKVTGFHNATPEIQFVCRRDLVPTINIDKNTERDVQEAVAAAGRVLGEHRVEVVDFTSHVDVSSEPGHYVIVWELSGEAGEEVLRECCNRLDGAFVDAGYTSSRRVGTIGALELRVVRRGTFLKVADHFVGMGSAVSQMKTPRCVGAHNQTLWQILCANVVQTFFSTAFG